MSIAMGRSKAMKRRSRGKKPRVPAIVSLPTELVTDVLARVAASSFTDFFNAKLSCKDFYEVADDKYIYQQVSLEKFPVIPWRISKEASSFLDRCKESGNPEALYRQGVVEYFTHVRLELGLECLNRAANLGHIEASYILGIILLCSEEEFKQRRGIELLEGMRNSKVTRVGECRRKLKPVIRRMWINNKLIDPKQKLASGCALRHQHKRRIGWALSESDDEDDLHCQACKFNCEVISFCNILRGV